MSPLSETQAVALGAAPFTYAEVGASAVERPPPGYHAMARSRALPGRTFDEVAEGLLTWQVQERSGLRVAASAARAAPGVVMLMRLGIGPASLRIPCRVVYVVEEPDRVGFAYGTLPGHPESGEELFVCQRDDQGAVSLALSAFSRPATILARLGAPVARGAQTLITGRYLRAFDRT